MTDNETGDVASNDIALVGMAGRFPGGRDVGELWEMIRAGRSGITSFTDAELRAAGVPEALLADPGYVKAGAVIDDIDQFDAGFFGISPKEAQVLDPQHRLFIEHSWIALEDAGCDPARFDGSIGVFAGCAWSTYLTSNLRPADAARDVGELTVALGNEKDCLPLRVAHLLGLSGPAFTVQSNCSTSLVAVCVAASSLASFECDMALAGGVSLSVPHRVGYLYQQGGITPPDARCRAFDAAGLGAPLGGGVAVVALRRLADALADGDRIYAVLRGWAVNNDAGRKVGFTAPGVDGQADVIAEALAAAGLEPGDIDYVEAHGTGTALGDAAEIAALQRVFRGESVRIGSVKTNIGHLDRAAGATGLIKTALSLHHGEIPATLNLAEPNPQFASGDAELTVVTDKHPWPPADRPRRAGVSAFGIGGTNAHVVLEEAPPISRPAAASRPEVLIWSARSAAAADQATAALAGHLQNATDGLADIANTLQRGRAVFAHRRMLVADSAAAAAAALRGGSEVAGGDVRTGRAGFLISGAPDPQLEGTEELYRNEPVFRAELDTCQDILAGLAGPDVIVGGLPATFAARYALAQLARSWGIEPAVVLGYGVGELVAGCLAGVLSLEHALALTVRLSADIAGLTDRDGAGWAGLAAWVAGHVTLNQPAIPLVSALTGLPVTAEQAADPAYWADVAVTSPDALAAAANAPLAEDEVLLLRIGPADPAEPAAGGCPDRSRLIVPTCPAAGDPRSQRTILAEAAGRLWLAGVPVDWAGYQAGRTLGRVGLPTVPFQRQRYWVDPPAARSSAGLAPGTSREAVHAAAASGTSGTANVTGAMGSADTASSAGADGHVQLLARRWEPAGPGEDGAPGGRYVIIPDDEGIGRTVAGLLRDAGAGVTMATSDRALADALAGQHAPGRTAVLYLRGLSDANERSAVLSAARTLASCAGDGTAAVSVFVVTRGGHAVTGAERVSPAQAALTVLPVVVAQEHLNLAAHGIDLDPGCDVAEAATALAAELTRRPAAQSAYRANRRYLPEYAPAVPDPGPTPAIRAGGRYLITGGLGPVGLALAGHMARRGAAQIVLTSRNDAPDDPGDPRASALGELRALGAEVRTPRVDAADPEAMRELLRGERFDGVVHAAAEADLSTFMPLRDLDEAVVARHFRAKVDGARVLSEVLGELPAERAPDWCVLFSSTSAVLGGITLGSYAAANAALLALAHARPAGRTRWIAPAWDTWPGTLERIGDRMGAVMAAHAMTREQALAAFDGLFSRHEPSVVVAAGGLDGRLPAPSVTGGSQEAAIATRYPRPDLPQPFVPPRTSTERTLAGIWSAVLGVEPVGTRDNFFDLSGNSLLALRMLVLVRERFGIAIPTVTLFESPTVHSLAAALDARLAEPDAQAGPVAQPAPVAQAPAAAVMEPAGTAAKVTVRSAEPEPSAGLELDRNVAVIGMAGRFPGAGDVAQFWRNLCDGVESISFFSPQELIASGVDPELIRDPSYVPARPVLDDVSGFDAGFFGLSPRMAALTDPQQRLFLEVCWEALEQAGYCRPENRGRVGVYGGCNISTYLLGMAGQFGLAGQFGSDEDVSLYEFVMGNDKDALTTTVSYLFDLRGPSVAVQTFCSTSLVAVHTAVRALRCGDCEMALAGGVSVRVPDRIGHRHTPGGMESPDGHVRTFDAQAHGSMFGDGATVVVLKRLSDALRDGDHIWSVIRGTALNNDGALKVGYTAPSVGGQAAVIADAMRDARVSADDIGYLEAHGTATELGDPIEVAALTRAFGQTARHQYCPIGSVKTNIGHLDRAAGTAGLIKTSMAVREGLIPPTLHFTAPNPEIDFEHSPFYVNATLARWPSDAGRPRIAGLNSLGMGGTNVHVVVEEPPVRPTAPDGDPRTGRRYQVLPVSARTAAAADEAARRLGEHLRAHPGIRLADVAYTLQAGRKTFEHRRVAVTAGGEAAAAALTGTAEVAGAGPLAARIEPALGRPVAFMFAGVGEQYPGMAGELYRREPTFRARLDECLGVLARTQAGTGRCQDFLTDLLTGDRGGGTSLATLLGRAGRPDDDERTSALRRTEVVQPLMFSVGYALAATLMEWGVQPAMMLGYSLGEYVAACLAGVMSLPDAIALVAHRAALIGATAPGAMTAVPLAAAELRERFVIEPRGLDVAAFNGPAMTVVAGSPAAVGELAAELESAGVPCRPLETTHAFHSRMLAPLRDELTEWIGSNVRLRPPAMPYLTNVTGGPADAELVCDPGYWARHMCEPVQFGAAAAALLADEELAIVEIGPGQSLGALLRTAGCPPQRWPLITATLPGAMDPRPADAVLADCLARLWLLGADIDWEAYHGRRRTDPPQYAGLPPGRVPLPTYPFQRQRYWIERSSSLQSPAAALASAPTRELAPSDSLREFDAIPLLPEDQWIHVPLWRQATAARAEQPPGRCWLVYAREGAAEEVLAELRRDAAATGASVTAVRPGDAYRATPDGFVVRPGHLDDALDMLRAVRASGTLPDRVIHLWTLAAGHPDRPGPDEAATLSLGLHSLVTLARAAGQLGMEEWSLDIATTGAHRVLSDREVRPAAAALAGPALVIPMEYPSVRTRLVDAEPDTTPADVAAELHRAAASRTVALRGGRRWLCGYEALPPVPVEDAATVLRAGGVYLITGGLGGIALGLARQLALDCGAKLVLFGRTGLPPRDQWAAIAAGAADVPGQIRDRVTQVLEITELGAEVEIVTGDVADPADVRRAISRALDRFGGLHGVLHTAGVPGAGLMQFKQPGDADRVLAPKVAGTKAIAEALRLGQPDEIRLDFLVLFSSITSVTGGGPGQVDYCAANAYLDAYPPGTASAGRRVLSVAWGEWTWNAWDDGLAGYQEDIQRFFRQHRARFGIGFEQGWRTLLRAIACGEPHVVVSTQDLTSVVQLAAGFNMNAVTSPASSGDDATRHPRPELVTPYREPDGATEQAVAQAWGQALRMDLVGAADNFFELGGTSLLGITLLATLRRSFPAADLPPHVIHEAPTVAALASVIEGTGSEPDRDAAVQGQARRSGLRAAAARRRRPPGGMASELSAN